MRDGVHTYNRLESTIICPQHLASDIQLKIEKCQGKVINAIVVMSFVIAEVSWSELWAAANFNLKLQHTIIISPDQQFMPIQIKNPQHCYVHMTWGEVWGEHVHYSVIMKMTLFPTNCMYTAYSICWPTKLNGKQLHFVDHLNAKQFNINCE